MVVEVEELVRRGEVCRRARRRVRRRPEGPAPTIMMLGLKGDDIVPVGGLVWGCKAVRWTCCFMLGGSVSKLVARPT